MRPTATPGQPTFYERWCGPADRRPTTRFCSKCSLKGMIRDLSAKNMETKLLRRGSGPQTVLRSTAMDRSANGRCGSGIEDEAADGMDRPKLSAGKFHSALLLWRSLW